MKKLKIAIQKAGRLNEKSVELLRNSGFIFDNYKSSLISTVSNFPLEILFLRDDDIPEYVQDGIADLGIVGLNLIHEAGVNINMLLNLGFGKCSLKIALPIQSPIKTLEDLNGKSIATSYPRILVEFLKKENLKADIKIINGSVEIATSLGLSDAICDLVSSGGTLKSNGLAPFLNILDSEAVLIGYPGLNSPLLSEILQRMQAVLKARETKYVVLNVESSNVEAIIKLLPGIKSPSILPLAESGWVAIHTVIPEKDFWERINQLKNAGAQGIVVMPIEKIIL